MLTGGGGADLQFNKINVQTGIHSRTDSECNYFNGAVVASRNKSCTTDGTGVALWR